MSYGDAPRDRDEAAIGHAAVVGLPVVRAPRRVLLALDCSAPIACRLCLGARYVSGYPAREWRRQLVELIHGW